MKVSACTLDWPQFQVVSPRAPIFVAAQERRFSCGNECVTQPVAAVHHCSSD